MTDKDNQFSKFGSGEIDILTLFALLPPPISLDTFVELSKLSPVTILNSLEILIKNEWVGCYEPAGIGHYALCQPEKACAILSFLQKQKIDLKITDLKSEANEVIGTMVRLDLPYLLD